MENRSERPAGEGSRTFLSYEGMAGRLSKLAMEVMLLNVVTLGMYRFWGKTRIRRYLWSNISLFGDRLEYTGTGTGLFLGFLLALGMMIPLVAVLGAIQFGFFADWEGNDFLVKTGTYILLSFLSGIAYYRARRYRVSHTTWRGIRFHQSGSAAGYALQFLGCGILALLTLGILRPLVDCTAQAYTVKNTWIGNTRFDFEGRTGDLMGIWLLCYVLAPFTIGLSLIWYSAFQTRYFTTKTRHQSFNFELPVTFWDYAKIYVPFYGALLVIILIASVLSTVIGGAYQLIVFIALIMTAWPALRLVMVSHRMLGLYSLRLSLLSVENISAIRQISHSDRHADEGLASALDSGVGLEVGF